MNKFGTLKTKILTKLSDSYSKENKGEIKDILVAIKENKEFKEMYLFYEEIENKFFDDREIAKLYIEEVNQILKNKSKEISKICDSIDKKIGSIEINVNEIYSNLDQLSEDDNLNNIDKKVIAKKKLVEHLLSKKETTISQPKTYIQNENLLLTVLTHGFNSLYSNTMNESEKNELIDILSISNDDLITKTTELKENIVNKVGSLLSESNDTDLITKLTNVKDEVLSMTLSKYNYYKLLQLKNGLD